MPHLIGIACGVVGPVCESVARRASGGPLGGAAEENVCGGFCCRRGAGFLGMGAGCRSGTERRAAGFVCGAGPGRCDGIPRSHVGSGTFVIEAARDCLRSGLRGSGSEYIWVLGGGARRRRLGCGLLVDARALARAWYDAGFAPARRLANPGADRIRGPVAERSREAERAGVQRLVSFDVGCWRIGSDGRARGDGVLAEGSPGRAQRSAQRSCRGRIRRRRRNPLYAVDREARLRHRWPLPRPPAIQRPAAVH